MSGHVRQRGKAGQWYAVIDELVDGRRKRRWHRLDNCKGKREAEKACERLIAQQGDGTYVTPSRMTVAEFLSGWLDHMQGQVSPRTHETYADLCRRHLVPLLGGEMLVKLRADQIREAYAKALASGRRDGQGGLSARYVTHMHRVLREALQQAFDDNLLARNPADVVKPPKVERKEVRVVNVDGAIELIEWARGDSLVHADLPCCPMRHAAPGDCGSALAKCAPSGWFCLGRRSHGADISRGAGKGDQER
jgi:hypothetical protein